MRKEECFGYNRNVEYLIRKRFQYIDDNRRLKTPRNELIMFNVDLDYNVNTVGTISDDFDPRAVLREDINYRKFFYNKGHKNLEILPYQVIFRKGWKIIKKPIIGRFKKNQKNKFCYYLRHESDGLERIGQVVNSQPVEVLIQLDNVNKKIRLIGKGINSDGSNYTSWRNYRL